MRARRHRRLYARARALELADKAAFWANVAEGASDDRAKEVCAQVALALAAASRAFTAAA